MLTRPVGPVEVFFYWPEAVLRNFYWPGAIGSPLASSPAREFSTHIIGYRLGEWREFDETMFSCTLNRFYWCVFVLKES